MYTNATMVCSVRTGTPRGKFEAPLPIPLCEKIKAIKLPLPSKVLQHYPSSKEETFMVGFQKPSCCCCFKRRQKPQFMRTIFVSTLNDKFLLIYDKEQNKGKKKRGASSTREGYCFKIGSASNVKISKDALISKMSKYTNQDEHHRILEISFAFGTIIIGMDGEKIISEWCPILLCAFDPVLIPPTPCDAFGSSCTNVIAPKQNDDTSKAALDATNKQKNTALVSGQTVDSSLSPPLPTVEEHPLEVSQKSVKNVTRESLRSNSVSHSPKKKRVKKKTKNKKKKEQKKKAVEADFIEGADAAKKDSFTSNDEDKILNKQEKDMSKDISSNISKNNEQKQNKVDRMERWFPSNSEDTSRLSADVHEAASRPIPKEIHKKLSDTSLSEIGPPLATSSLADINSTTDDKLNVVHKYKDDKVFSRVIGHNKNVLSTQHQQLTTKENYQPKQQKHRFINHISSNSSFIPVNENRDDGSCSITSCISTSEQKTFLEPDLGYQFTWVPKHLNEEEMIKVNKEIEKKTQRLAQSVGEPFGAQYISKATYHCNKPLGTGETRKQVEENWLPDTLHEHKSKNQAVLTTQKGRRAPLSQSSYMVDNLQRPFQMQTAKKVTTISSEGSAKKSPKQVRWLSPRREFNDIPRPYQVSPIQQTSSSLGYIVRRYGFNDDIIGSGCVYDGGDNSTQLQHFCPLGSEVAMRENGREANNRNHELLNVRKLFEQRITAFLDKGNNGTMNNNLAAIGPATIKPVASALELNNNKSKMETNNSNKQNKAEAQNDNKQQRLLKQKSTILDKCQRSPPPPPLLFNQHISSTRAQKELSESNV